MKYLKLFLLVVGTYTVSEFLTMWRMQPKRTTLKQFSKTYINAQKLAGAAAFNAGETYGKDPQRGKELMSDLVFKNYAE